MKYMDAINKKISFRSISEILLYVFALIIISGFVTDSIFNGLILNSFAKKYLNKPHGIFKILTFPNLFLLIPILCFYIIEAIDFNMNIEYNPKEAIFQIILIFFVRILTTAIYLRGGNILVIILIHSIMYATIYFRYAFLKFTTFNKYVNQFNYLNLIYIPVCLLLTVFLLRKSKIEEVKENLKTINEI